MSLIIITDKFGTPIQDTSGAILVQKEDREVKFITLLSPSDDEPKTNAECPGGKEGDMNASRNFSDAATRMLLAKYLEKKGRFRNPKIKRAILWKELAEEINKYGYSFTEQAIERKFRNMKNHFLKIRDNNTKTGRGRKSWQYYDMMENLFENDACVHPVSPVSSMMYSKKIYNLNDPKDVEYLLSTVTDDMAMNSDAEGSEDADYSIPLSRVESSGSAKTSTDFDTIPIEPPEVSNINFTEETNMKKSESTQNYNQPSCSFGETLQTISPKPTRPKQTKRVIRRKETSKILTSTPVKDALERQEEDRKKIVKPKPRTELQTNKKIKIVKSKRNRKDMEASTSKIQDECSEESDSASDVDCLYCVSKYSASRGGEAWIQCQGCRNWAHEECAGIDDFEDEFLCLICNN
ncbi:hypothetical protein RN001_004169 [Aquatica leii]|uniref:Zinc finger PHD-type domain-containing protein n=1 Tax=Aquatica leii TaxID=1421715 RepID=A0AAN7QPH2_9COLE|nr:hypothetical protein RN001_004169 [Aquatica leii]